MKIYYQSRLKELSRKLRNSSTVAEVFLWNYLKNKQIRGYRFSRQRPIGKYIVDFYCHALRLVVEIDGITHGMKEADDLVRQSFLEQLGLTVLRFNDSEVRNDTAGVVDSILQWVEDYVKNNPPTPFTKGDN